MSTLSSVILEGLAGAIPAASIAGRLYFTTDTLHVFRDSGTAWVDVTPGGAGLTNPMTTAGDIIVGGASGAPGRLPVGANGQVLTIVSGAPAYAAASGGGGSGAFAGPNAAWQFDDFLSSNLSSALGWGQNGGGAGAYFANGASNAADHPGNWNIQANSNGQWLFVMLGPANTASTVALTTAVSATIVACCIVNSPYSTAGGTTTFGWYDNTGGTSPNGVFFHHDNIVNGNDNWWAFVVVGGTVTKTDTGVSAIAAWHNLELVVVGTAVTFLIDGISVATGTGIGASNYAPGFFAWNNAGPATNIFFDWFAMQLDFPR